jgi:hypothetical protein
MNGNNVYSYSYNSIKRYRIKRISAGKGCVLWGAIEKGDGSGFIEIGKDDESQDTPAEPGA